MTKNDLQLFVEQLLNGEPIAVFKFIGIVAGVLILCFLIRKIMRSKILKVALIVFGCVLVAGFITDSDMMIAKFTNWKEQLWGEDTENKRVLD